MTVQLPLEDGHGKNGRLLSAVPRKPKERETKSYPLLVGDELEVDFRRTKNSVLDRQAMNGIKKEPHPESV
jgi:hypothetical protein